MTTQTKMLPYFLQTNLTGKNDGSANVDRLGFFHKLATLVCKERIVIQPGYIHPIVKGALEILP